MNNGGMLALMALGAVLLISDVGISVFIGISIVSVVLGVGVFRLRTRRIRRALK